MATLQTTVFSLFSHFVVFLQLKKRKEKEKIWAGKSVWNTQGWFEPLNATRHASSIAVSWTTKAILEATLHLLSGFLNPIPVTVSI